MLQTGRKRSTTEYVALSPSGEFVSHSGYIHALQRYCRDLRITVISTHGLRHSTSTLYMAHGASRNDLRMLFGHSTERVTDRYVHDNGEKLNGVANNVLLFRNPGDRGSGGSPKFPHEEKIRTQEDPNIFSLPVINV